MAKASSSKPQARPRIEDPALKAKGRPVKIIQKTIDLVKSNDQRKRSSKGKGKEKEALGELAGSLERKFGLRRSLSIHDKTDRVERRSLPGGIQVERFAEVCRHC